MVSDINTFILFIYLLNLQEDFNIPWYTPLVSPSTHPYSSRRARMRLTFSIVIQNRIKIFYDTDIHFFSLQSPRLSVGS